MSGSQSDRWNRHSLFRRTLSSRQTFIAKFIVPVFFLAASAVVPFIFMTSDLPLTWLNVLLTLILTAIIIAPSSAYIPMKVVKLNWPYLKVSNYMKEISVHLADVKYVEYVQRFKFKFVVLTLKRRSEFGRQIKFMPQVTWKVWKEHEVVDELKRLVRVAELEQSMEQRL